MGNLHVPTFYSTFYILLRLGTCTEWGAVHVPNLSVLSDASESKKKVLSCSWLFHKIFLQEGSAIFVELYHITSSIIKVIG